MSVVISKVATQRASAHLEREATENVATSKAVPASAMPVASEQIGELANAALE
jgi:hypothetical protein